MDDKAQFQRAIAAYVEDQPTQAVAARKLGLNRQTVHRYVKGQSHPRVKRRRDLLRLIGGGPEGGEAMKMPPQLSSLDDESLRGFRDLMVHLVTLIDLDVASRAGKERKGG
ncbi:helix-turn-helix domain-containing protein [Sphingomonas sp. RIT328]|uniref:helix-turn-helix domain-containing protein n=1 Tax=Sphingomonas sp. RIT328 TaxID=1470591 RepID=UPI000449EC81|nr:helix-turn-helix domain-containing protein [Sphingomonas sp. RIT328]EZP52686.1 hypothetical protein BW41_02449 [Sphingomonas sp. RIT328]